MEDVRKQSVLCYSFRDLSEKEDLCVFTHPEECTLVGGVPLNAFNSLISA